MIDAAEKLRVVRSHVTKERKRRGIKETDLHTAHLPEFSCEGLGEGFNLVERQLMSTKEGYGAWECLKGEMLDLAYQYVVTGCRG